MLDNMLKSGKVYDFDAHTELIKRRSIPFIGLWFCLVFFVTCCISFILGSRSVIAVFCVLVFQVFTYEPELSPIGCVKKACSLSKDISLQLLC